jgi:hypothetical protein
MRLLTNSADPGNAGGIRIDELRITTDWPSAVYGMVFPEPAGGDLVVTSAGFNLSDEFEVTVEGLVPGTTYFLQRSLDLADGFPTTVDTQVAGSTTETLTDTAPPSGKAFYRVSD